MLTKRTYEDGCAAAHALNLVGERWALLVVRELLLGPKRFSDLRDGLPGISPNVLSQRLRDLEASGVVRREQLPPPAASRVYALTPWGAELEVVLQDLGRWGARAPERPSAPISQATLVTALKTMFSPAAAGDLRAQVALRSGREHFTAEVGGGQLTVTRGRAPAPQAVLEGDANALSALFFNGGSLAEAEEAGTLRASGDRALLDRFARLFPLPKPVEEPAGGRSPAAD